MSANTKPVTDQTFSSDVLKADGPVLVDFWAEWCGPCKMIGPALEELAGEFAGKLTVAKVNIDENPLTPNNYAVRGIPTLILFKNGQPAATQVGALPKASAKRRDEGFGAAPIGDRGRAPIPVGAAHSCEGVIRIRIDIGGDV